MVVVLLVLVLLDMSHDVDGPGADSSGIARHDVDGPGAASSGIARHDVDGPGADIILLDMM